MTVPTYKKSRLLTVLTLALLFAVSCSSNPPVAAPDSTVIPDSDAQPSATMADDPAEPSESVDLNDDPADQIDLSGELQSTIEEWEGEVDGGGVAWVRDASGGTYALAAGDDPASGQSLDAQDRVRVGSISKVFTAVMVMQLVDDGLVDLDAPVSTYVSDLELANDVTIRQLLGHRTGIPNYTQAPGFFAVILANPDREPEPTDMIAFTNSGSDFDPGTEFAYSNTNYIVAGMVVEAVTDQTLNEALDERINSPLGLVDTAFDDGTFPDVAHGYSGLMPSGNTFDQSYNSMARSAWAAGSLVTTVEELARFFDAAFASTELISVDRQTEMLGDLDDGAGYGLGLHSGPDFGVGHGGTIAGFSSIAEIDLETMEMVVVVVNNDSRAPSVLSRKLSEQLEAAS